MGKKKSAYFVFADSVRAQVKEELVLLAESGKVSVAEVAKAIGEKWAGLTDDEKAAFKQRALELDAEGAGGMRGRGPALTCQPRITRHATAAQCQGHHGSSSTHSGPRTRAAPSRDPTPPPPTHTHHPAEAAASPGSQAGGAAEEAGGDGSDPAPPSLAASLVKRIMMLDPEVARASKDAVWLVGHATELLLGLLAERGAAMAVSKKRSTVKLEDLQLAVRWAATRGSSCSSPTPSPTPRRGQGAGLLLQRGWLLPPPPPAEAAPRARTQAGQAPGGCGTAGGGGGCRHV